MIDLKNIATQFPQLYNLKPDISSIDLQPVIQKEDQAEKKQQQDINLSKNRMLALMNQGSYELMLRIMKSLKKDTDLKTIEDYAKQPESFYHDVLSLIKSQSRDEGKFNTVVNQYRQEFNQHFKKSMNEWETWQKNLFQHQIDIISVYLAYKTIEGEVTEHAVIKELIQGLDPLDIDVTKGVAFMKGKRNQDIMTTGFLSILAVLGLLIMRKHG
jgi:hypothetical protein